MSTFYSDTQPMMSAVAERVAEVDEQMDVHTVTLVLNGQHGEFDLTVEATDDDMEDHTYRGVAHRGGGVTEFAEVER